MKLVLENWHLFAKIWRFKLGIGVYEFDPWIQVVETIILAEWSITAYNPIIRIQKSAIQDYLSGD